MAVISGEAVRGCISGKVVICGGRERSQANLLYQGLLGKAVVL